VSKFAPKNKKEANDKTQKDPVWITDSDFVADILRKV
jgi:hypothetical protein